MKLERCRHPFGKRQVRNWERSPEYFRGYGKTSYGVSEIEKKNFVINTEKLRPDLGLATGDPDIKTFDLGSPFISPPPSLSHIILFC
jgi:hypothetical protein